LLSTRCNAIEIVNKLLEKKPNVNALDKDGCTALTIACKEGYSDICSALIKADAYVNVQVNNNIRRIDESMNCSFLIPMCDDRRTEVEIPI